MQHTKKTQDLKKTTTAINLKKFIKDNKTELIFFTLLILITISLRIPQLGYSHFYGDETKVLFLRKDTSAQDFLLNQRKGPIQFISAWGMEKLTGGYDEGAIRLPFALAGIAAVIVLYLITRKLFDWRAAFVSALIFSLNGFAVAFSRTAQYQTFVMFFGLLSILFSIYAVSSLLEANKRLSKKSKLFLFLSGITLALAYLAHYDALFYDIAVGIILIKFVVESKSTKKAVLDIGLYLVVPFLLLVGAFYLPYLLGGYFSEYTFNYVSKRLVGDVALPNSSLATIGLYNYLPLMLFPLAFSVLAFAKEISWKTISLLIWFGGSFIVLQLLFSNPGTHIYNYLIPLFILSGIGIIWVYDALSSRLSKYLYFALFFMIFALTYVIMAFFFLPKFNTGYPWKTSSLGILTFEKPSRDTQLFIYGFPYNRGWDKVAQYFEENGRPRSFYTNDNVTIGEYYLHGIPAVIPQDLQRPEVFIFVNDNQEQRDWKVKDMNTVLVDYGDITVYTK